LSRDCNANDWYVNKEKSSVKCDSNNLCSFDVWVIRPFDTHDPQDYLIDEADPELYSMIGFYNSYSNTTVANPK